MHRWGAALLATGIVAAASNAAAAPILFRTDATVSGRVVRLGDIADLSRLPAPLAGRAARLEIAVLKRGAPSTTVSARDVVRLVRGRMPALDPWLVAPRRQIIRMRVVGDDSQANAGTPPCARVARPVAARSFVTVADLAPAPCGAAPIQAAFRYEPTLASTRALMDLKAGELVEAPPVSTMATVRPGERVQAMAQIGRVSIEREVEALQPARPGGALFVRADNGDVFSLAARDVQP